MDYGRVDKLTKIMQLKQLLMPITEVFGQVLPRNNVTCLNKLIMQQHGIMLNINPNRIDVDQMAIWTGIEPPIDRWEIIQCKYLYKLVKNKSRKVIMFHKWFDKKWETDDLPVFEECRRTKKKYLQQFFGAGIGSIESEWVRNIKGYQRVNRMNRLHEKHPFNILKVYGYKKTTYCIMEVNAIKQHVPHTTQNTIDQYYEIFYNFGALDARNRQEKRCNLCENRWKIHQ